MSSECLAEAHRLHHSACSLSLLKAFHSRLFFILFPFVPAGYVSPLPGVLAPSCFPSACLQVLHGDKAFGLATRDRDSG